METKTIEERAKEVMKTYQFDEEHHSLEVVCRRLYIQGAKEQRDINIQKAVEIYEHELKEIVAVINRFSKNKVGDVISIEGSVKDFEKAMKGVNQ